MDEMKKSNSRFFLGWTSICCLPCLRHLNFTESRETKREDIRPDKRTNIKDYFSFKIHKQWFRGIRDGGFELKWQPDLEIETDSTALSSNQAELHLPRWGWSFLTPPNNQLRAVSNLKTNLKIYRILTVLRGEKDNTEGVKRDLFWQPESPESTFLAFSTEGAASCG